MQESAAVLPSRDVPTLVRPGLWGGEATHAIKWDATPELLSGDTLTPAPPPFTPQHPGACASRLYASVFQLVMSIPNVVNETNGSKLPIEIHIHVNSHHFSIDIPALCHTDLCNT